MKIMDIFQNQTQLASQAQLFIVGWLVAASSWTKLGGAPGVAVANNWDKNGNGWVGFYKSTGYDGARRAVATR